MKISPYSSNRLHIKHRGKVAKWATAKRGVERERMKAIPNPWIATFPAGTAAKGE